MSENKDVLPTAKKQMRLSERLLAEIPGFRGYKEKELRRESDKLIRNHLFQKLAQARSDYKMVFQKIADNRQLDVFSDMDRLSAKFDRAAERISHASYGYSGFFDAIKIQEDALDRMTNFDNQLMDQITGIANQVTAFKGEVAKQSFDNVKDRVQNITDSLDTLNDTLDKREEVIMGVN